MKRNLPDGYRVFISHYRKFKGTNMLMTRWDGKEEGLGTPLPHGGATEATILDATGEPVATALALCSKRDMFNKAIGRNIAIGRALKQMSISS